LTRLILDTTDVLVGVKAELGDSDPQFPNQGRVHVSVEW
jgi:exosome complex RNA-binding protein Rrp42 (RNase PH superfamily)